MHALLSRNRFIILTLSGALILSPLFAQDAPEFEREEVNNSAPVQFINRTNQRASAEMRAQDVTAGQTLAGQVVETRESANNDVQVRRLFDPANPGLGADVLTIGPRANFGHINRIQRILTGYLMKAFEYNEADATTVSRFVLYYNARQRGNMEAVRQRYSEAVAGAVTPERVGIDRSYRNWAGNTQILLPLRKNVTRPDQTELNDQEIENQTRDDATTTEQNDLNRIQEERTQETTTRIQEQNEQIQDQRQNIQDQQQQTQQQLEDANRRLQDVQNDPNATPEQVEQAQNEVTQLQEQQENLQQQDQQLADQQTENNQNLQEIQNQQENQDVAATDTTATTNTDNAATDTATDTNATTTTTQQDEAAEEPDVSQNVIQNKILFMRVVRYFQGGHYSNELWAIDSNADDALFRSPFTNICSREFTTIQDVGVLVTGYSGTNQDHNPNDHHLVMLDPETLAKKAESAEVVYWRTPMEWRDQKIYAFAEVEGQHYIARFNPDLTLDVRGGVAGNPNSMITFTQDKIYITSMPQSQGAPTAIHVFNRSDLKHIRTIDANALQRAMSGG